MYEFEFHLFLVDYCIVQSSVFVCVCVYVCWQLSIEWIFFHLSIVKCPGNQGSAASRGGRHCLEFCVFFQILVVVTIPNLVKKKLKKFKHCEFFLFSFHFIFLFCFVSADTDTHTSEWNEKEKNSLVGHWKRNEATKKNRVHNIWFRFWLDS